jgi:hypothetical protein
VLPELALRVRPLRFEVEVILIKVLLFDDSSLNPSVLDMTFNELMVVEKVDKI